ncbi:unnamed protein product, partial [Heterosigma akashiwo]
YRLAEKEVDKIQTTCDELEQQDIIKKSCSPYNSPCLLVNKSDGSSRFCLDLRSLNGYLAPASYPTDSIKDNFDYLGDNNWWFTSLDVKSAFWSIKVHDLDTEKLAFTVRQNKYEFVRMPFGLTTSPFSWALLMNMVLSDAKFSHLHLHHVQDIFTRLIDANLRLKIEKCNFGCSEVSYLGYRVGRDGLKSDPDKVMAVTKLARPETKKDIRRFLGMAGYYRSMIRNFSTIAAPLHEMTKNINPEKLRWSESAEASFQGLKQALTTHPVLKLPNFKSGDFSLETDASKTGIGGVLMQVDEEGRNRPVAFTSRLTKPAEKNYSVYDLELLSVIHCIQTFRQYIYG